MHRMTFTAEPGKQEMIVKRVFDAPQERLFRACSVFKSVSDRDAMLSAEMEAGVADTTQRLATLLANWAD